MTQRGNEVFGAVLDSVGAVIVQVVKAVYGDGKLGRKTAPEFAAIKRNIDHGDGVGRDLISDLEPTITRHTAEQAITVLKATGS